MTTKGDIWIDQFLYVCIAFFAFNQAFLSNDDVYKYISPLLLFWMKYGAGAGAAISGALKMYRSTGFADHKTSTGNTAFITKPPT